jgi:hypothetical protein
VEELPPKQMKDMKMLYWNGTESRWYYAQVVALKVVKDRIVESCKQIERTVSSEERE